MSYAKKSPSAVSNGDEAGFGNGDDLFSENEAVLDCDDETPLGDDAVGFAFHEESNTSVADIDSFGVAEDSSSSVADIDSFGVAEDSSSSAAIVDRFGVESCVAGELVLSLASSSHLFVSFTVSGGSLDMGCDSGERCRRAHWVSVGRALVQLSS